MINMAHLLLFLGLLWYMVLWTVTDQVPFESFLYSIRTKRGLLTIFLEAIMTLQALAVIHLDLPIQFHTSVSTWLGVSIMLTGMTLASWAKIVMKSSWGIPAQHDITKQKTLVTIGPFAYIRNPIYLGLLLYFIGFELALASWLITGAIPLFILIRKAITKEEVLLTKHFGKSYTAYCKKVPRFLFF